MEEPMVSIVRLGAKIHELRTQQTQIEQVLGQTQADLNAVGGAIQILEQLISEANLTASVPKERPDDQTA